MKIALVAAFLLAVNVLASPAAADQPVIKTATKGRTHQLPTTVRKAAMPPSKNTPKAAHSSSSSSSNSTSVPNLVFGGSGAAVFANPTLYAVFWGSSVNSDVTSKLPDFLKAFGSAPYFAWLNEYDAGGKHIAGTTWGDKFTITPANTKTNISDDEIRAEMVAQMKAGHITKASGEAIYVIAFPKGTVIHDGTDTSANKSKSASGDVSFCAYHKHYDGSDVPHFKYAIVPDVDGVSGCGGGTLRYFDHITMAVSHELVETITDAQDSGWYDSNDKSGKTDQWGEIGDICNAQYGSMSGQAGGYAIQRMWSNKQSTCLVCTNSKTRGAGTIPKSCPSSQDEDAGLCYDKCKSGYKGVGPVCWESCPSGYTDTGGHCTKPKSYGRGAGYALWDKKKCEKAHGSCEKNGAMYYPHCKSGFHAVGCCVCSPDCPSEMTDIGVSCQKKSYGRGVGKVHSCADSEDKDAGLCYKKCDTGYTGVGPVCWADNCSFWNAKGSAGN